MTKQMKETLKNFIELDKSVIDEKIAELGEYTSEGIYIKKWLPNKEEYNEEEQENRLEKNENKYLANLKTNGCQYSGSLNDKFQREGYGLELYNNGDKYFGQFDSNSRNENGIYFFAPFKKEGSENPQNIQNECFLGQWKNNLKDKNGMYIWMDQPENNYQFQNANFDAYVGEFEEEKYFRGTYLSKIKNDYYLYHGNFDKEGKKSDENAYFFISKTNKIFHGKIIKDVLNKGYLGSFDKEGEKITELYYCKFNEDGSIGDIIEEKDLNEEDNEEEKRNMINFRSIIFDMDYFGKIYNKFSKIKIRIDKLEDMAGILENDDNITEINKILNKYTKKNIYFAIEENFFGREM